MRNETLNDAQKKALQILHDELRADAGRRNLSIFIDQNALDTEQGTLQIRFDNATMVLKTMPFFFYPFADQIESLRKAHKEVLKHESTESAFLRLSEGLIPEAEEGPNQFTLRPQWAHPITPTESTTTAAQSEDRLNEALIAVREAPQAGALLVFPSATRETLRRAKSLEEGAKRVADSALELMDRSDGWRMAPAIPAPDGVRALAETFPNFKQVADDLADRLTLLRRAERAGTAQLLKLPNLMLYGPPGIGKTAFCRALAEALAVDFSVLPCHASTAGFALIGHDAAWRGGRPGRIFDLIAKSESANPILLLDELDKINVHNDHNPLGALLAMLEPENSERLTDDFILAPMNASGLNLFATANEPQTLPEPLLSRFTGYFIDAPRGEAAIKVARSVYKTVLEEKGWTQIFSAEPGPVLETMAMQTPRDLRASLERALARAATEDRDELCEEDFAASAAPPKRRMGF